MNPEASASHGHWTRRQFMERTGLAAAALSFAAGTAARAADADLGMQRGEGGFPLPALPYPVDALEPVIDAQTMGIHHGRHHAGYTRKFNAALESAGGVSGTVEEILAAIDRLPVEVQVAVRNNGGGYYNHSLFWRVMAPDGGGEPGGALGEAVRSSFGSFAAMREAFSAAAGSRFGSGWAWLTVQADGTLAVGSTPNQDNPWMRGISNLSGVPVLGLDVWEHAYYLKYQNRRTAYIDAWWNIVHWGEVEALYQAAIAG